ncbi:unnamed protein product [Allacma fusca]|uniref:Uncharacterized protein n=1 Tax=Allacma fusca TaxID=39272 RepID=A0A8J2J1X8_9HEXA|nr:unnamed protein product [Allacma fusca]
MNLENSSQDKLEAWSQSTGMSMNLPTDATASSAGACPFRTYNHSQSLPVGHYDTSKSERKWYRDAMKRVVDVCEREDLLSVLCS